MPDDTQELCCAAGICCDHPKQKAALAKYLHAHAPVSLADAEVCAQAIIDGFDLVPRGLLTPLIDFVQTHPYK